MTLLGIRGPHTTATIRIRQFCVWGDGDGPQRPAGSGKGARKIRLSALQEKVQVCGKCTVCCAARGQLRSAHSFSMTLTQHITNSTLYLFLSISIYSLPTLSLSIYGIYVFL